MEFWREFLLNVKEVRWLVCLFTFCIWKETHALWLRVKSNAGGHRDWPGHHDDRLAQQIWRIE
jgi:hypothetical protein